MWHHRGLLIMRFLHRALRPELCGILWSFAAFLAGSLSAGCGAAPQSAPSCPPGYQPVREVEHEKPSEQVPIRTISDYEQQWDLLRAMYQSAVGSFNPMDSQQQLQMMPTQVPLESDDYSIAREAYPSHGRSVFEKKGSKYKGCPAPYASMEDLKETTKPEASFQDEIMKAFANVHLKKKQQADEVMRQMQAFQSIGH